MTNGQVVGVAVMAAVILYVFVSKVVLKHSIFTRVAAA